MVPRLIRATKKIDSDRLIASAASAGTINGSADERHARIAAHAYQLYEQRGREDGRDLDDWLTAEQQILAAEQPDHAL
jgi:outer membrane protein TolC